MAAVDNPHLVANMRRGQSPSVDRVQALCEVLELEFYIGPKRGTFTVDEERLALALETAERGLSKGERAMDIAQMQRPAPLHVARLERRAVLDQQRRHRRVSWGLRGNQGAV